MPAQHVDEIEYLPVELDAHDVLIAEGVPSESFIDDDSRSTFHNAHEFHSLYQDQAPRRRGTSLRAASGGGL